MNNALAVTVCPCCRKSPIAYAVVQHHKPASTLYLCEGCRPGHKVHPVLNPVAAPTGRDYTSRFYAVRFLGGC